MSQVTTQRISFDLLNVSVDLFIQILILNFLLLQGGGGSLMAEQCHAVDWNVVSSPIQ
jgi:hypothetical protein